MSKNKFIFLHGYKGWPENYWFPWLASKITERGHECELLNLPEPENPHFKLWMTTLNTAISEPTNTILIGHSLGGATVLQYLNEATKPISGTVLIGTPINDLGRDPIKEFYKKPFDWAKMSTNAKIKVVINSDNDQFIPVEQGDELAQKMAAEYHLFHDFAHFDINNEFPELLAIMKKHW